MKNVAVADLRSFAILGHSGSGKTSLVDALLFKMGMNDRLGSVPAGSSMADYTDEEKGRKISIFTKPFSGVFKTSGGKTAQLVFADTPGYLDFHGQVMAASRGMDTALIVVDAAAGAQIGTHRAWFTCQKTGLTARGIVITGLDRDNTDYARTLEAVQAAFGDHCVPVLLPKSDLSGVVDVMAGADAAGNLAGQAGAARGRLVELAAETDDKLIEKYLSGEELSADEIARGIERAVGMGKLVPVFVCLPLKDVGVSELMDGMVRFFPSPEARAQSDAKGNAIPTGASDPFVGFVWRTVNDPFVGQLAFVRVLGGTLTSDSEVHNASKGQKERIGSLLVVNGKKQETITTATAGDVVALAKLKTTTVGDTLCDIGCSTVCAPLALPNPVCFQAVHAKTQADEDKLRVALSRVCDEDPALQIQRNRDTRETVLAGLGDVQIDVAVELMKRRSNVEVLLSTPKVPYRETVTGTGEGHYKHKKQTGGRGQYGEVYLRVLPLPHGEEEWFEDAIVGGVIPHNFVPAVQKGLVDGMQTGSVAGYPVTGVRVSVYDGSYHEVDSSEIAFKISGARAFKDGMSKAKPVLLEPIMTVKVMVPDHFMGDVTGDLNHKRGRILGIGNEGGMQVITAEVPQAELFRYAAELRSMTGGKGSFDMTFGRYEIVPANVALKVIEAAAKDKKEEEEE